MAASPSLLHEIGPMPLLEKSLSLPTSKDNRGRAASIEKVWEAAAETVKDEEAIEQKLYEDLNQLVQEGCSSQFTGLE